MQWLDNFMEFTTNWYVWVPLLVVAIGLIGAFIFMRMRKTDD